MDGGEGQCELMARDAIDCRCGLYQCRAALNVCFITRPSDNGTTTPPWIPFRPDASASDVPGMERARGSAPRFAARSDPLLAVPCRFEFRPDDGRRRVTLRYLSVQPYTINSRSTRRVFRDLAVIILNYSCKSRRDRRTEQPQFRRQIEYFCILMSVSWDGSVAEWLSCWTQAQKVLGSNRSRDAVG